MLSTGLVSFILLALSATPVQSSSRPQFHNINPRHHQFDHDKRRQDSSSIQLRANDDTKKLMKRGYSGRASFFAPGLGACGVYSKASDYMVALNEDMYGDLGAVSSWCFQTITISYGGKTAQAQILDACPGCPYGGLDMSPGLFNHFASPDVGIFYMTWSAGGSDPKTTTTTQKPTTTWTPPPTTAWTSTTTKTTTTTTTTTTAYTSSTSSNSTSSTTSKALTTSSANSTSSTSTAASTTTTGSNLDAVAQLVIMMGQLVNDAVQVHQ